MQVSELQETLENSTPRPEFIMSLSECFMICTEINDKMKEVVDSGNITNISEKLAEMVQYHGISPLTVASSKWYFEAYRKSIYEKIFKRFETTDNQLIKNLTSKTLIKDFVGTYASDYEAIYNFCERTNRAVVHYTDALRSLLSKEKELLKAIPSSF